MEGGAAEAMTRSHYYTGRRRGPARLVSDTVLGVTLEFYVAPGVFSTEGIDEGTRLLLETARVPEEGTVLDMGCGYGAIGIALAKRHPGLRVVMVDVNPLAVDLARRNARLNQVEDRVEVLHGNLYEPLEGRVFDAILSNPPLAAGMETVLGIIRGAPGHLAPGGTLWLVMRKGAAKALEEMKKLFPEARIARRKKGYTILMAKSLK